jgi:catechol 2,3-dioxygenase-like lactoylglutathione lyase family enzyme
MDKAKLKLGFVIIFVSNFERSFKFYTDTLGMELDFTDRQSWAQFKSAEDISLSIQVCDPERQEQGCKLVGRFTGITLLAENISDTYELLKNIGVKFTTTPRKQPWGGTTALFTDPDGNVLELMESSEE